MTKIKVTITDLDDTVLESFTVESVGETEETFARRVADERIKEIWQRHRARHLSATPQTGE